MFPSSDNATAPRNGLSKQLEIPGGKPIQISPPKRETNGGRQLISGEQQSQFLVGKKNRELTGVPDVPRDKNGSDRSG